MTSKIHKALAEVTDTSKPRLQGSSLCIPKKYYTAFVVEVLQLFGKPEGNDYTTTGEYSYPFGLTDDEACTARLEQSRVYGKRLLMHFVPEGPAPFSATDYAINFSPLYMRTPEGKFAQGIGAVLLEDGLPLEIVSPDSNFYPYMVGTLALIREASIREADRNELLDATRPLAAS